MITQSKRTAKQTCLYNRGIAMKKIPQLSVSGFVLFIFVLASACSYQDAVVVDVNGEAWGFVSGDSETIIFGANPSQFAGSPIYKQLYGELTSEGLFPQTMNMWKWGTELLLDPEQYKKVVVFPGLTESKMLKYHEVEFPHGWLQSYFEKIDEFKNFEKRDKDEQEYWATTVDAGQWGGKTPLAFTKTAKGMIAGTRTSIEEAISLMKDDSQSLKYDERFREVHNLIDTDATSFGLLWDLDFESPYVERMAGMMILDEEELRRNAAGESVEVEQYKNLVKDLTAFGFSAYLDDHLRVRFTAVYKSEQAAKLVDQFIKGDDELYSLFIVKFAFVAPATALTSASSIFPGLLISWVIGSSQMMGATYGLEADHPEVQKFIANMEISLDGSKITMEMVFSEAFLKQIIMDLLKNLHSQYQGITVSRIGELGNYVDEFTNDNPDIGSPKVDDIDALLAIIIEREGEISPTRREYLESLKKDIWGNDFIYQCDSTPEAKGYTIMSLGADGKLGPALASPPAVSRPAEDIIWINGQFKQRTALANWEKKSDDKKSSGKTK